jgi:hypothetical protein
MLNLYGCVRLHTRQAEESPRQGWKRCDSPICVSGTLQDGFRREEPDHATWPEAEKQACGNMDSAGPRSYGYQRRETTRLSLVMPG